MKMNLAKVGIAVLIGLFICTGSVTGQNIDRIKQSARTAAAGISVSTANGKTTLTYKGKEVWTGKTSGRVTARSKAVNDQEYAAAFDGTKVIWESSPGAAKQVK
jgi:hypothetical protein